MEPTPELFARCEAHFDRFLDYSPSIEASAQAEAQALIAKLEHKMANESLKASDKSTALYLLAGLNLLRDTPSPETEGNLLKSVP